MRLGEMTLAELIRALDRLGEQPTRFGLTTPHQYCEFKDELAFCLTESQIASTVKETVEATIGLSFDGYEIGPYTPVNVVPELDCHGEPLTHGGFRFYFGEADDQAE